MAQKRKDKNSERWGMIFGDQQRGMRMRRNKKRLWFGLGVVFVAMFVFTFLVTKFSRGEVVEAANLANFDPGYIISDYQMGNYSSMSEAEIQAFLTAKNPCSNRDQNLYNELSAKYRNVSWHWEDGHFVCLSEERFGEGVTIGSGETAAHIIWQAAQDYRINPQVLLVLLQKEQGLITDTFPNSIQYRSATGYGCPDTAVCNEKYYGFKNQIRNAAALFRTVLDGGWTNYPLGNNYIQYNPDSGCGGSVVNVRNLATSALYRYTPYQPNAGALAAGYGTAYCGAYGNRNFYLYFEDWFGGITADEVLETWNRVPADVEEGVYVITTAINATNAVDISGGAEASKNGTNIQAWEENSTNAQKWNIIKNDDLTYTLINPVTEKVLDVTGGSKKEGANVQLWESNGTCAQRWKIEQEGEHYVFVSSCSNLVLDVEGGSSKNGANIQLWFSNGTDAQEWLLSEIKEEESEKLELEIDENRIDGIYSIHPMFDTEKALDVENGSFADMSNVQIYTFWDGNAAQEWEIKKNEKEDYYVIKNAHSHKVMDVAGGILGNNTNIWIYSENNTCAQRWKLFLQDDDSYKIVNACEEKMALDVQDYYKNVQLYTGWGENNSAQKWKLNKIR